MAVTRNAAHALNRGHRVGQLAPGFQADLLIHRYDTVEELAYWVGPNPVARTIKSGRAAA